MNKIWIKYFGEPNWKEKISREYAQVLRNWIKENNI